MEDKLLSNYINHLNKIKRNDIQFQDVSHLLIFMRLIIEKENLKNTYPNISFFSDWYLHTKLDRNSFSKKRLESIYSLMVSKFSNEEAMLKFNNDDDFFEKIDQIMGINDLKREIIKFFTDFEVSNSFSDENYSNNFLRLYLTGICDRPLIFQGDSTKLIENISIEGFQFLEIESKIHFEILTSSINNSFVFKFLTKKNK